VLHVVLHGFGGASAIAAFNLLPFRPLAGREAWRLPWLVALRVRHSWLAWRLGRVRRAAARAKRHRLH